VIDLSLPEPLMLALRWGLFLGPIALVLVQARLLGLSERARIGGLFAFLYGLGMIFVTNSLAVEVGWWRYGWDALMLNKIPADILIGGAVLFGPGLYYLFPDTRPLMICLPIVVGLHGTIFSSLKPLVFAGPYWFAGVVVVFVTAHIPALYLAKWTERDVHLPLRCALLALMTGAMMFAVLPTLIMETMGGTWAILDRPVPSTVLTCVALSLVSLIGLSANQMLCLQGVGTPIPLDPTKRLVRTGIYAYVSNPMQLSAVLGWIVLGAYLRNVWVMAAALMAWVFVQGMVRWHNRHDLLKRFPEGWPAYKSNVPEWRPRWRPWAAATGELTLDPRCKALRGLLMCATALDVRLASGPARYSNPAEVREFEGTAACLMALTHVNFAWTLVAQAGLIVVLGAQYVWRHTSLGRGVLA
jgi:protein-S-isoprenylcysteine O-methyltransferase Ste14